MNYFDIIIIIPLLWGGYKGFKKGLIIEVASIVALLLGVWGGIKFSSISANYLGDMFSISEKLMPLISFALTFILIVIAVFAVAKLIQKVVKVVALSTVNKVAGAAFGILKFTRESRLFLVFWAEPDSEDEKTRFMRGFYARGVFFVNWLFLLLIFSSSFLDFGYDEKPI